MLGVRHSRRIIYWDKLDMNDSWTRSVDVYLSLVNQLITGDVFRSGRTYPMVPDGASLRMTTPQSYYISDRRHAKYQHGRTGIVINRCK
jgi:hypothetical protein